jgi:hypothetical protein
MVELGRGRGAHRLAGAGRRRDAAETLMAPRSRFSSALRAALLLVAAASSDAVVAAQPMVWRIDSGDTTHYIAGSVHALRASDYPLPDAYAKAYASTTRLVLEVDSSEVDGGRARQAALDAGRLPRGQKLCTTLGKKDCAEAEGLAKAAGLSLRPVARFEPWLAALTLTAEGMREHGLDAALGVDRHLMERARADQRPVLGLETAAAQFAAFDGLPEAVQKRLLLDSLRQLPTLPTELEAIVAAWREGDLAKMEAQQDGIGAAPELHRALFVERHARWLPQLQPLLGSSTPTLVVVGAQHLVGPDSLLLGLERAGFVLKRLD